MVLRRIRSRRRRHAALLALGQAARSALAGAGLPITPWLWGSFAVLVLLAGLVVLVVRITSSPSGGDAVDAGGGTARSVDPGELVGPDGGRIGWLPLGPGDSDEDPDEPLPSPRDAGLELHLGPNTDLRHLRYTLTYHPHDPDDPHEVVFLHHARLDIRKLELVPAQQVASDPMRYRWPQAGQARLCFSGIELDRDHPSCEGIVRISSQRTGVRAALARLTMLATPQPPTGLPGENDAVERQATTLSARKVLALRDVFFVTTLRSGVNRAWLHVVERDETGGGYRVRTLPDVTHQLSGARIFELELARDGSRLYLSSADERSLFEWRGQADGPVAIANFPWWDARLFGGMTATDSGLCVVEMVHEGAVPASAALRCRKQSSGAWGPARPLVSTLLGQGQTEPPAYAMASLGDSVLAVLRQRRQQGELDASYTPDAWASQQPLQTVTLQYSANGPDRLLQGALALAGQGTHQDYAVFGRFALQDGQSMSLIPVGADALGSQSAHVSAGVPFSPYGSRNSSIDRGAAWVDPASQVARILLYQSDGLRSLYFDLLRRRPIQEQAIDAPPGWRLTAAFNLLELDSRPQQLVVAGQPLRPDAAVSLLVYSLPGFGLPVRFEAAVDLLGDVDPLLRESFATAITRNVLWLTPAEPDD